ncbi:MAG: isoprenylcysteine carboxylmethyltransferase family protein [Erysipelotrichaceae bacterium]|nr:isoprenylcysteine carboxylmethyltransferase family protein [Erysipelotrichaceae bacterium]
MNKRMLSFITYSSVVIFSCILATLIFLGCSNWSFVRGWIFCVSFCMPTFCITAYFLRVDPELIERRIFPKETRPSQIVGQGIAGLLFFGLILISSIDHRFGWTGVPCAISVLADICIVVGFVIVFKVFGVNSFASRAIETMINQKVITSGPYSIVRHPMYAGALLIILSIPLSLDSIIGMLPGVLLLVVIIFRIRDEEKMLLEELDGYKEYCEKCKYRVIPFIW